MEVQQTLEEFYKSFQKGDAKGMTSKYAADVRFEDPAFGILNGQRAHAMWHMLLSKDNKANVTYEITETTLKTGTVRWVATYNYGPKKRPVVNKVKATFLFKDGFIIEHQDSFDLWQWSRQALGLSGYLMGWSPQMKLKIQEKTNAMLDNFIQTRK